MKWLAIAAVAGACGKSEDRMETVTVNGVEIGVADPRNDPRFDPWLNPQRGVDSISDAALSARPDAAIDAPPPIALPSRTFPAKSVIGKGRAEVARILGPGKKLDDGTVFDRYAPTEVMVSFENERAAVIGISPPGYTGSEADRDALMKWCGLEFGDDWRMPPGESFQVWDSAALQRFSERIDFATSAQTIWQTLRPESDLKFGVSDEMRTSLDIIGDTTCTQQSLASLYRTFAKFKDWPRSFKAMRCRDSNVRFAIR